MKFIHMLVYYEKYFSILKKEIKGKENLKLSVDKGIKNMRINILMFVLVNLIIYFIVLYYLSLFCAVYPKTQISLLKNFGIGLAEYVIIIVVIMFFITCLRVIGLRCKSQKLYETSKYIQDFL